MSLNLSPDNNEDTSTNNKTLDFSLNSNRTRKLLSETQQTKLLQYFEDQLLHIQRRYVSRLSPPSGYKNFDELIKDINKLVDVIWYSILSSEPKSIHDVPYLENLSSTSSTSTTVKYQSISLFGQTHHLLAIADQLVDYIEGYSKQPAPQSTINIINKLDNIFKAILDQDNNSIFTETEKIRLESIAERTRIAVALAFENVDGYEDDVGKVYENVLDRIT